jgi:vacuolar protein sorting-associated protein 13A/C
VIALVKRQAQRNKVRKSSSNYAIMAKAVLLDVLEKTIGKYVKNLDPESLSVAVWSGKIELNSLELDVESINSMLDKKAEEAPNLAMPFKVLSGRFESFQVDVPWSKISSSPVVLRARGLSVMVEPLDRSSSQFFDDDDTAEHDLIRNMKRAAKQKELREEQVDESNTYRLQAYALKKIALAAEKDNANDGDTSTFASRLSRRIMENIQIEISDVHVSLRNEDGAAGVVLESLKLMATDKQGRFVYVDRTGNNSRNSSDLSFQYKMLQIEGFGIYLDKDEFENARKSLRSVSEDQMSVVSDNSSVYSRRSLGHSFVLAPLSFQTSLRIADKTSCMDNSKYELRSKLSVLSFLLTRSQVDTVRKVAKIMSPSNIGPIPLFPEYRPLVVVKGHGNEWWKYASRCIGRMSGRRLWVEFFQAFQKRKQYIPLFKRHSHSTECSWVKPLNKNELDDLVSIEQDRAISIEGLMAWRNIADAQIDKEKEKRKSVEQEATSSMFSYVFGSRAAKSPESEATQIDEEPAIVLSAEEMKELEEISKFDIAENDIAKDALYYDVKFVLDAMKVDLVGYHSNHLALLDMGKVTIDFDAKTDGAYTTSFDLYDLQIFDRTTPNSLFPSVLKKIESGSEANISRALHLDLSKSSTGNQSLVLKLAEFQLVASKLMAQELQLFFEDSSNKLTGAKMKSNPLLRKSLSGSVDLFYDAKGGDSSLPSIQIPHQVEDETNAINSPEVKDILSNKLVDAWKEKSMGKVTWMVDIDVRAPIVLIPEVCNSSEANVMVFDLGNLKVKYGKGAPSSLLQQWFDEYPRDSVNDETFETGTININDFSFSVQKASFWHPTYSDNAKGCAIIDPIGVVIDFAVEDIGPEFEPRSCFLGVIPTISLKLSHVQGSQILEVINAWTDMFHGQEQDINPQKDIMSLRSPLKDSDRNARTEQLNSTPSKQIINSQEHDSSDSSVEESCPMIYCRIGLQRLSVIIMNEGEKQLEAHLVSVYASLLQSSDESSIIRLTMGWFWVLDWIVTNYARKQRLLIHSNLPRSAESFAQRNEYNIIEELTKEGVFERQYSGSTQLADVSYKTLPRNATSLSAEDINKYQNLEGCIKSNQIRSILDAKFRSLVVHWNPHAIKEISALSSRFLDVVSSDDTLDAAGTLISTPLKRQAPSGTELSRRISDKEDVESSNSLLIMAEMESLGVVLNSARDDLPLFTLTVSGTRLSIVPRAAGQEISLSLGDLRIATPENSGKTLLDYRTLLGLEHGSSGSLLTIKYCEGREAIETLDLELAEIENFEAVAVVELSPMRFCYIQSQVMTLSNYITDGILGALAAQAAISAAEAAKELANSVTGHYFFSIRATSFEAIIPEAAYRDENMRLKTASLNVDYFMYSDTRGSDIRIALSNLMVKGDLQRELQESPINLSIDVKMPIIGVGSLDDQAMRVNAEISKVKFVLTKDQYSQIMNTLEKNISETALFLREDEFSGQIMTSAKETHSGVQLDQSTQRMYFILDIKEVSLLLNGRDRTDPLVQLTATETTISMDMIPDLEKFSMNALLQNLVCEDCRLVALRRQSRFLIDASKGMDDDESKDIFQVKYCQENATTNIDLTLGSPQVVLIPDLISEVLLFVGGTESKQQDTNQPSTMVEGQETSSLNEQVIQVDSIGGEEVIERNLRSSNTSVTKISAQTGTCRFVLMDLGSQSTIDEETKGYAEILDSRPQLTETVVIQGIFAGSLSMESSVDLGEILAANFQFNSDAMEIFTAFGREMKSPLQILEPASASIHGSLKSTVAGDTEIEVRAAALTSIAFSFSIHNAALLMAIIDSVNDSFKDAEETSAVELENEPSCLTLKEQERIQKLATALEQMGHSESVAYNDGSSFADSRASSFQQMSEVDSPVKMKVQIKVTMPKARITFINDLQGMNEALFRISVTNFVAGGILTSPTMLFEFNCNTSILADYFDSSVNLWSRLLIKPWEVTVKGNRTPSHRFKSKRLSSTFDLESFPCWISFSEQFLVSLASAARMWSIYSAASNGSLEQRPEENNASNRNRTAARNLNLITSFPNAISNHSGIDISFSLESGSIKDRACPTECTQYFRFDPPKGAGYGGTRVYGQDVEIPKNVEITAKESVVVINMDLQLGLSACGHEIGDKLVLYTRVVKEGKTTVRLLGSFLFYPEYGIIF